MKKKFSLWLNIATICLCVCAIAIGVYALQEARLDVTGTIGFKAHGIKYTVAAEGKGYSTALENGTYYDDWHTIQEATTEKEGDYDLDLGAMYFTDTHADGVPNIEIKITITNKSEFIDVLVVPNMATCTGVAITSPEGGVATKNGGTTSIIYSLSLKKDEKGEYEQFSVNNLSISIDLKKFVAKTDKNGNELVVSKYTPEEQADIWDKTVGEHSSLFEKCGYSNDSPCYATYFPYYITLGCEEGTGTAIKWLIVGYNNNGTIATLTNEDKAALASKRLINGKNYVALSAEGLELLEFNSSYQHYENGIDTDDYFLSDIRTYLCNTNDDGFVKKYSLTSPSISIKSRALSELYVGLSLSNGKISSFAEYGDTEDDFWLLSRDEINELFKNNITNEKYASASITTGSNNVSLWWLRSPSTSSRGYMICNGQLDYSFEVFSGASLRPAFQF